MVCRTNGFDVLSRIPSKRPRRPSESPLINPSTSDTLNSGDSHPKTRAASGRPASECIAICPPRTIPISCTRASRSSLSAWSPAKPNRCQNVLTCSSIIGFLVLVTGSRTSASNEPRNLLRILPRCSSSLEIWEAKPRTDPAAPGVSHPPQAEPGRETVGPVCVDGRSVSGSALFRGLL